MIPLTTRYASLTVVVIFLVVIVWTWERLLDADGLAVNTAQPIQQEGAIVQADSSSLSVTSSEVVGLVFYGRREFVRLLDCYLKVGFRIVVLSFVPLCASERNERLCSPRG